MLASILNLAANIGYPSLFLLVLAESGGVPLPGETALVTGALLASEHKLQIPIVIALAASAAIIGDNLGYLVGRKGGRWLLERPGPFARSRREVLNVGVPFFERHGARAVFFGRWLIGLRTWASWLAGVTHMPRRSFVIWNAAGAISWATTIGLLAYFAGSGAKSFLASFGIYGLVTSAVTLAIAVLWRRHSRPRDDRSPRAPHPAAAHQPPTRNASPSPPYSRRRSTDRPQSRQLPCKVIPRLRLQSGRRSDRKEHPHVQVGNSNNHASTITVYQLDLSRSSAEFHVCTWWPHCLPDDPRPSSAGTTVSEPRPIRQLAAPPTA